jgi:hypothetical protein
LKDNDCGTKYVITEFDVWEVAFTKHRITGKLVIAVTSCLSPPLVTLSEFMDSVYFIRWSPIFSEIWAGTRFGLSVTIIEITSRYNVELSPIILVGPMFE